MYWRDGTVYRGFFRDDEQNGYGVKLDGGGAVELQFWQNGNLEVSEKMEKNDRCTLEHLGRFWMFDSDGCINGLATGKGNAVSFSGTSVIVGGEFILGRLVEGEVIEYPSSDNSLLLKPDD